jgi:DNA-binding NtrC family response regulator
MGDVSDDRTSTMETRRGSAVGATRRALRWRMTAGADAGKSGEIVSGSAIVGRAASADIRVVDPTVSQFHVELHATDGGVDVLDLGSHNGTRVNDIEVRAAKVPGGAELRIGESAMVLELGAPYRVELSKTSDFGTLVGAAPAMREVYAVLERLARSDVHVVLEGEPGTGKHSAARGLHDASRRAAAPFVVVRCSGLPSALATTALFGDASSEGVFASAKGGTVLLSEIGELPADVQRRLADALAVRKEIEDVRIIATSTRGLKQLVNTGALNEELYLELAQARVRMPALVERREDVKALVLHFLASLPWTLQAARSITPDALEAIAARSFRGNVRELRTTVERTALLAEGAQITADDLAFERLVAADEASSSRILAAHDASDEPAPSELEPFKDAKRTVVDEFEKAYLSRLLARAGTNISRAAALAGIERQSLRDLLKRHGLRGEDGG